MPDRDSRRKELFQEELSQDEYAYEFRRWRSDITDKVDELIRTEKARAVKYDAFIDLMILRETRRAELHQAVISKTLGGLIWLAVLGLLSLAWNGALSEIVPLLNKAKATKE